MNWQKRVYRPIKDKYNKTEWKKTENAVFARDNYRCQSCYQYHDCLTAHHIIPRIEGGKDDMDNLITLCNDCHDEIEETNIRSFYEIRGYNSPENISKREDKNRNCGSDIEEMLLRVDANRPNWHIKVYGCL
jgi:5-methylcytosine-specific restriction endonuclease McrA